MKAVSYVAVTSHLAGTQHDPSALFTHHQALITDMPFTQHDVTSPHGFEDVWDLK